ncbi:NAD(P)/FAD-dependent oxidoreductase [Nocardioides sp. TRM66260-LWL]|uniref:flavin-containing monooxygenase n=1 Tax=Nocardioides sp. TRM66260-LWL TaxID=2874478 RepID=UPI001CC629B8|nr:NAD(P)/FAD-dependent oxidoreductase [Nocardioides sp. TRM66260-LWL]MBZ5736167.1 NAD(P)/FAD-dependent oxidoreductase [Nocardioides sp. TRM66260-LWL]
MAQQSLPQPASDARDAAPRRHTVVVIGSGFGGQCAAIELARRGIDDVVLLERRDFMGGTWCQNSYPGAAVDVQSPLYSISSEPYAWSRMFAQQEELQEYTEHVIAKHGLRERTVTGANVTEVRWVEDGWEIRTEAAGTFHAQFLINASGPLSTPVVPPFPGREDFQGAAFHTNDWHHDVDLRGKRVAIVGSGASAAQVIPAIQPDVAELHVFQRSPHWVLPRPDRVFTPLQRRLLGVRPLHKALRTAIYWSLETRVIGFKYSEAMLKKVAQDKALKHIERQIADPELRRKVTPDYTIGCKRIILSDTLYPALAAENTTLHDRSDGIDHLDATGIVTASGEHLDLDVVVWSTGYDATDGVISYPVVGRDGTTLADFWSEFPRAYLGTTAPGFPNLFVVTGPNTGIGHTSAIFVIEAQLQYIVRAIDEVRRRRVTSIEVTPEAEDAYTAMVHREMERTVWKKGGCSSWYQSRSGHVIAMFPGFSFTFRRLAARFRPEHHAFG